MGMGSLSLDPPQEVGTDALTERQRQEEEELEREQEALLMQVKRADSLLIASQTLQTLQSTP